ncbi:MAG: hypothetical protein N3I35_02070 [Clostridia bacterium]|nr:hypothetical protein [Clostridia bacterium]
MNRRKLYTSMLLAIILVLAVGLFSATEWNKYRQNNTPGQQNKEVKNNEITKIKTDKDSKQKYLQINRQLTALLPDKENYKWIYNGFAEYGHTMVLKSINKSAKETIYITEGTVEDVSGGEAGKEPGYYNLGIKYTVREGVLYQIKNEQAMMDSIFDTIELIRAPLNKNNKWIQNLTDKSGKKYVVECEITDIGQENNLKVYTVSYKDTGSDYYEIRKIMEGTGVISFAKQWEDQDNNQFEIGYSLYSEASGYYK